jgi:DnaJ-class molecular chaperone
MTEPKPQVWWALCDSCEGRGDDGNLLWPSRCYDCGGKGVVRWSDEPQDDEYWEGDEE